MSAMGNVEWGMGKETRRSRRAVALRTRSATTSFPLPHSPFPIRTGLTLIELLVVVLIATTLVVGVVPLLSPNNDARKIREAARELHTYLARAQAEAARAGRPYGVAFRETAPDSGFALEAFMIAEPAPFAGFYDYSKVVRVPGSGLTVLQFVWYDSSGGGGFREEPMPPGMLRRGDRVEIDGIVYELIDPDRDGDGNPDTGGTPPFARGDYYGNPANPSQFIKSSFAAVPVEGREPPYETPNFSYVDINGQTQQIPNASSPRPYVIHRQPVNTSAAPLSFPRGIGIDLVASGFDRVKFDNPMVRDPNYVGLPVSTPTPANPQFGRLLSEVWTTANSTGPNPTPYVFNPLAPLVVGIMFEPKGQVDSVIVNGERQAQFNQVFLMLGRLENAQSGVRQAAWDAGDYLTLPADLANRVDFTGMGNSGADKDEFEDRRDELNWLNEDSRWVAIGARSGRIVASPNRYIDPRNATGVDFDLDTIPGQVDFDDQITAAQGLAAEMKRLGDQ